MGAGQRPHNAVFGHGEHKTILWQMFVLWPAICASQACGQDQRQIFKMQSQNENKRSRKIQSILLNAAGMLLVAIFTALWALFLIRLALYLIKHLFGRI
jgi:hypothetical protein